MLREPGFDRWRLVGAADEVDVEPVWDRGVDLRQVLLELDRTVTAVQGGDDEADIQSWARNKLDAKSVALLFSFNGSPTTTRFPDCQ